MRTATDTLAALRRRVAAIETIGTVRRPGAAPRFGLDRGEVDVALGGGLAFGALHEIHAGSVADNAAANGFAAMLALRAAEESGMGEGAASSARPIVWIRQDYAVRETGDLHADGLAALGFDPSALILVRLRDAVSVLRAAIDVGRCAALGAVIVELWGEPKALDLTTQRRLVLAAEASGVTLLLLRPGAAPMPGGAETRWLIRAGPAEALAANAPGPPTFELTLLRHRHGTPGGPWRLEWNRDDKFFRPAISSSPALLRDPAADAEFRPAAPSAGGAVLRFAGRDAASDRGEGEGRAADRRAGSGGA